MVRGTYFGRFLVTARAGRFVRGQIQRWHILYLAILQGTSIHEEIGIPSVCGPELPLQYEPVPVLKRSKVLTEWQLVTSSHTAMAAKGSPAQCDVLAQMTSAPKKESGA